MPIYRNQQEFLRAADAWKTYSPVEDETDDICPDCEEAGREGWVTGDRWEWWCTNEECSYGGDNIP